MSKKEKPCLVSCSVLKGEIERLVQLGDLDVELVFVSKYFHVDYAVLEKNLRQVIEKTQLRFPGRIVLVYGDLCLGQDNEMKKLAEEYGIVKVDALNCIDCQLGGKGQLLNADPDHDLMFLGPGMIDFFRHFQEKMRKENIDEEMLAKLFSGFKGIVILDTLGEANRNREEIEKLNAGLPILEIREVGLAKLKRVILEAVEKNNQKNP